MCVCVCVRVCIEPLYRISLIFYSLNFYKLYQNCPKLSLI